MGYADLVDFDKKIRGSFMQKVVKKIVQERLSWEVDFMLVNGCVVWNMSAKLKGVIRTKIDNSTWRMYVAELILN